VVQVGDGIGDWVEVGDWFYISQYAGQIISLEGVGEATDEARLICTVQDLLCRFAIQAEPMIEKAFAA
jgi:hypothetical protein